MVEGSGLENRRYASIRGFESHSLRQKEMHPCGCIFFFGMEICRVGFERRLLAGYRDASSLLKRKLDYDMLFVKR